MYLLEEQCGSGEEGPLILQWGWSSSGIWICHEGEICCGCECEAVGLPTLCTTLPACPALHLDSKFKPVLGWPSHTLPPTNPSVLLTSGLLTNNMELIPPGPNTLPIWRNSPHLVLSGPLPSSLEQPPGFQSYVQAEDPTSSQAQTFPSSPSWI